MRCVLVTGSTGFVGEYVVKQLLRSGIYVLGVSSDENRDIDDSYYEHLQIDLTNCLDVEALFDRYDITHVVHLAAIADIRKGMDDSWSHYYRINTLCSKTLFSCAAKKDIPVFFASSIDVYGMTDGLVDENTIPSPIGNYARSKFLAEKILRQLCRRYTIARFAPIYSDFNKTDMNKRCYIRYPDVCFMFGNGRNYNFLSVDRVAELIANWCWTPEAYPPLLNVCDENSISTKALIESEQIRGRAGKVIRIPEAFAYMLRPVYRLRTETAFKISKIVEPIKLSKDI